MRYFFTSYILFICIQFSFGQNDTTINERSYKILETYNDGSLKYIGQFHKTCSDDSLRKHGYFIHLDSDGNEIKRKLYFFDEDRNRKVLALKYGWWGWYGKTEKYFLGIRTTHPVLVDSCF